MYVADPPVEIRRLRSADWRRSWRTEITPERSRSAPLRNKAGTEVVLVGDAGYLKDLITAHGINEAFRDAERCAVALNECLTGARSFNQAMIDYQRDRDAKVLPMYEFTRQLASLDPPPPEMQRISAMEPLAERFRQVAPR